MKTAPFALALLAAVGTAVAQAQAPSQSQDEKPAPPAETKSFDASAIDKTADPCTDFYQYACGNWIKNNPIPADQVRWGSFNMLAERNRYLLWKELDAAANNPKTPLQKKYGDYYAACMNTDLIDQKGIEPLKSPLDQIAALKSTKDIATVVSALEKQGDGVPLFRFGVQQDQKDSTKQIAGVMQAGLSLPDRDYYLVDNKRFNTIRDQYRAHVTKMFTLAGDSPDQAAKEADAVIAIETALAKVSTPRVDLRDPEKRYHIYTVADFQKLTPDFDFSVYFKDIDVRHFDTLNVATPDFFKGLNEQIASQPIDAWKSYLRWHTIHSTASELPKSFRDENFEFFGKTLAGQKEQTPRWKQCTAQTDRALGEAVGQDWVKENFPPKAKASMDKLVAALDKALADDIKTLPWMSDETKKAAEAKLELYRNKIGYPEKWRDYSALTVKRDDALGNARRTDVFDRNYNLNKLGKPVDEKEWGMTPPTVNAYYSPSNNDINFPAGILQPPFFDPNIDPAVNFGGIGVVIGHEMTHGFDDQGSKYDGHGNLREWQTADDRQKFNERTDCEVKEYNGFETAPAHDGIAAQNLNGKLTLGENTADNGGLRIAYMALLDTLAQDGKSIDDKIDGYTEAQRFFIGFAQVWCSNQTEQSARQLALTDPHSPGKWRTNGSVQNFDGFAKAWNCKKGQPMYPENACRVW
ncbi:M13 family metallopeptidase [Occallatibacter riparius]|uniref:M13 family metallopeptidase n=1 Tax=Occallatibacter riparius TaxID=1002689 RepID=A0A9J7BYW3_9BACT|nr:M13 family metallopeptidase [Occallatibacter riparius]UWZ86638.1 M13 family metallopeptidase [Occallatibacter riparius]